MPEATPSAAGYRRSGDFVDRDGIRNAAQQPLPLCRRHAAFSQQPCRAEAIDDGPGRANRRRVGETLHARGNVDRLPEIILPFIEHDREAWPLMDADLEQQILLAMLGVK